MFGVLTMSQGIMRKTKSISQLKQELREVKQKPARVGVHHTKVVPDKTKYSRKMKHKKKEV